MVDRFPARAGTALLIAAFALASTGLVAASAAADDPPSALALAQAIAVEPIHVTGAQFETQPPGQSSFVGNGSTPGAVGFPKEGSTFAILTTGPGDLGGATQRGPFNFDVTVLRVDVFAPPGTVCLAGIDVKMMSKTTYAADVNSSDRLVIEIDQSTWKQDGDYFAAPFVAPHSIAVDDFGSALTAGVRDGTAKLTLSRAEGTQYNMSTRTLTARAPISPGPHSIYFSLIDRGSALVDTTVFIDNLRFADTGPCPAAVIAAPGDVMTAPAPHFANTGHPTGTITIPAHSGLRFAPFGAPAYPAVIPAGEHAGPGGGTFTVDAQPTGDTVLQGPSRWSNVFANYAGGWPVEHDPPAPTFTTDAVGGTVTIPTRPNVAYRINGVPVAAGDHKVHGEVIVHAVAGTNRLVEGVTGWSAEFSGPVPAGPPAVVTMVTKPTISGDAKVGSKLTASTGTWNPSSVTLAYQWLRNGAAIKNAKAKTYTLTAADAGRSISVKVTASKQNFTGASTVSAAKTVGKIGSKTTGKLTAKKVTTKQNGKVQVKVAVKGIASPTGKVRIYYAGKTKTVSLKSGAKGKITVTLPKLKKGTYTIKAKYLGSTPSKASAKVTIGTLTVKKP